MNKIRRSLSKRGIIMTTVYVLRSLKTRKRYVGVTEQPLEARLNDHNWGRVNWTSSHRLFELLYSEVFESAELAGKREKFLKTGKGRKVLDNLCPNDQPTIIQSG
jgi:putative endonuclease